MCITSTLTAIRMMGLDPSAKLVLITIADCARDGVAFPSMRYIREITAYDERTVKGAVVRLIAAGLLVDTGGRKGRNRTVRVFRVNLAARADPNSVRSVAKDVRDSPRCSDGTKKLAPTISRSPTKMERLEPRNSAVGTPAKLQVNPINQNNTPEDAYASSSPKPARTPPRRRKGRPLPEDWLPPPPARLPPSTFALVQDWNQERWDAEADSFRDYCLTGTGKDARSANWDREWALWIRHVGFAERTKAKGARKHVERLAEVSRPPVRERGMEGERELALRAALQNSGCDQNWLGRSAFALACLDPARPFQSIGLKIFTRPTDKTAVESYAGSIERIASRLGYDVRWHRVEDGTI
jgi:hypothetical protein